MPVATGSRQADIEGLRAIAALMILTSHLPWYQYFPDGVWPAAPQWLSPRAPLLGIGGLAVVLFLVISGAGLCRLIVLKSPPYVAYVRGRVWKIFSVYWSAGVIGLAIAAVLGLLGRVPAWTVVLTLLGLGFVDVRSFAALYPSWWYIGIAWQVVACMPLLVFGMRRLRPAGVLVVTALVVLASCYFVPAAGLAFSEKSLIFCRALEVLGGAFLALELWPEVRERLGVSRREAGLLVVATIGCLLLLLLTGLGGRWIYRAAGLGIVAAVVYARPLQRLGAARVASLAVWGGGMSFAFYLLHEPVMLVVRRLTGAPSGISLAALAAVSLVAVMMVAVLFQKGSTAFSARASARRRAKGESR